MHLFISFGIDPTSTQECLLHMEAWVFNPSEQSSPWSRVKMSGTSSYQPSNIAKCCLPCKRFSLPSLTEDWRESHTVIHHQHDAKDCIESKHHFTLLSSVISLKSKGESITWTTSPFSNTIYLVGSLSIAEHQGDQHLTLELDYSRSVQISGLLKGSIRTPIGLSMQSEDCKQSVTCTMGKVGYSRNPRDTYLQTLVRFPSPKNIPSGTKYGTM